MLDLNQELRKLREVADPAPKATEQAVIAAFRRRHAARLPVWRLAAAAVLIAACGTWLWFANHRADNPKSAAVQQPAQHATDFYVLDPLAPGVRDGHGRLVRIALPPGVAFGGVTTPWSDAGSAVQAEVLLGDDGPAHAVRFIY